MDGKNIKEQLRESWTTTRPSSSPMLEMEASPLLDYEVSFQFLNDINFPGNAPIENHILGLYRILWDSYQEGSDTPPEPIRLGDTTQNILWDAGIIVKQQDMNIPWPMPRWRTLFSFEEFSWGWRELVDNISLKQEIIKAQAREMLILRDFVAYWYVSSILEIGRGKYAPRVDLGTYVDSIDKDGNSHLWDRLLTDYLNMPHHRSFLEAPAFSEFGQPGLLLMAAPESGLSPELAGRICQAVLKSVASAKHKELSKHLHELYVARLIAVTRSKEMAMAHIQRVAPMYRMLVHPFQQLLDVSTVHSVTEGKAMHQVAKSPQQPNKAKIASEVAKTPKKAKYSKSK